MEKTLKILGIIVIVAVLVAIYFTAPVGQVPINSNQQGAQQETQQQAQEEDTVEDDDNTCSTTSGKTMTLGEAKVIALASDCGDRIDVEAVCNPVTGTWWIDMDVQKPGCSPACVVDIETEQAEVNWRCTGLAV